MGVEMGRYRRDGGISTGLMEEAKEKQLRAKGRKMGWRSVEKLP